MNPLIRLKRVTPLFFIALAVLYFGILPKAQAVIPPPDGGYPGGNTAEGQNALLSRTTGGFNTALGWFSLKSLTTASFNTGVGAGTLVLNSGDQNTATGSAALLLNTTGLNNTANGALAILNNTEGSFNTASGANALMSNTTGSQNTAIGGGALFHNITGHDNIALGFNAGANIFGSNNINIGSAGADTDSGTIRIGQSGSQFLTFIAGIRGQTTQIPDAVPVVIDSAGQLGTTVSSRRYKKEIKPMNQTSEAILGLKPVTFHYKSDKTNTPQFGLIAEEVAAVNPNLVVRDKDGEIYTVRYDAVNAMLLNEFLKEHRTVQELKSNAAKQEATIAKQEKQIEALTAGLQLVSAQLELSKPAPQTVKNTD